MNLQDTFRRITIKGETQDVDKATGQLNKLSDAQQRVGDTGKVMAQQTDTSAKRQLSAENAYKKLTLQIDETARANANIARATKTADAAFNQGIITQSQYADAVKKIHERYEVGSNATNRYVQTLDALHGQYLKLTAAAASWAIAYNAIANSSLALADRAGKLQDFGETTGYTVEQLQALEKAGGQVGVTSEAIVKALEKLSVGMDSVKKSSGDVYDGLLEVDPALAKQMARVKDVSEAWDILAKASAKADLTQRNALAKAAFGRGGIEITRVQSYAAERGGLDALTKQLNVLDKLTAAQTKRWDELGDAIAQNMKDAKQVIVSIFADSVLETLDRMAKAMLELARAAKEFTLSDSFKAFLEWSQTPGGMAVLAGGAGAALGGMVGGPIGALAGGATGAFTGAARGLQYQERGNQAERYGTPITVTPTVMPAAMDEAVAKMQALKEETIRAYNETSKWMSVIGSAATPAEKYQLELLKVGKALAENAVTEQQAGRARAEAARTFATETLNQRISALGEAASITDVLRAKELALARANQQGAGISQDQINKILQVTAAQKLGTFQLQTMIDSEKVRIDTLFMSREAALAYTIVQERINKAAQTGEPLSEEEIEQLRRKAEAYAKIKGNADKYEEALRDARETGEQFTRDLVQGLLAGKSAMEALGDAAKALATNMANKAIQSLMGGQYEKAAVEATIALGAALFGRNADQEKARAEWKASAPSFGQFIEPGAASAVPANDNICNEEYNVCVQHRLAA